MAVAALNTRNCQPAKDATHDDQPPHASMLTRRLARTRAGWRGRRLRANPRVVKRKMSNYHVKHREHRSPPKPTKHPDDTVTILAA